MKKIVGLLLCFASFFVVSFTKKAMAENTSNKQHKNHHKDFEKHFEKMKQIIEESFKMADRNNDEKLDKSEHYKFIDTIKQKKDELRKQMEAKMPSRDEMFAMSDLNNDGFISKDEINQPRNKKQKCSKCKGDDCKCD